MFFQQRNNETESSQLNQNRKSRENFQKKIRKEILDKKIAQMRKTLFIDKNNENTTEIITEQESFLNYFGQRYKKNLLAQSVSLQQKQITQIIQKTIQILFKFSKISLQSCSSSQTKKFQQKIDAIICLMMKVDQWIEKDLATKDIEKEMGECSKEKIQLDGDGPEVYLRSQRQNRLQTISDCMMQLDELKPIKWTQSSCQSSRLQLLKQIGCLLLFQKIQLFLNTILSYNQKQLQSPQLISPTFLQWLYFYQSNMKTFYTSSRKEYTHTLQDQGQDEYWFAFTSSYFEIAFKTISLMSLTQLTEIFFNSIQNVGCFMNTEQGCWKDFEYIECSPCEYLLGNENEGQKVLRQLYQRMGQKIQAKERQQFCEQLRRVSLNETIINESAHQQQAIEILKAKRLLSALQTILQSSFAKPHTA